VVVLTGAEAKADAEESKTALLVHDRQEGRLGLLDRPEEGGVGDVRGRQRLADQRREDIEQ
jgi:hypothetical protein